MLQALQKNNFLVIGRAGMDLYADPPGALVEKADAFTAALGGSSANIAVAISKQGGKAALMTSVSDDAVGRFTLNQLDRYGIETHLVRATGGQSRTTLAVVETRLENCQSVIYRNGAADFEMTEQEVGSVDFSGFGALIATGTCFASEPSRSATFLALEKARKSALPVILDLDYRPYSWPSQSDAGDICLKAARMCDIIVGNDEEFATLAGSHTAGQSLAAELARTENRLVIYKMGEKGSVTYSGTDIVETGIFRVNALKPTGSGDAFLGNLVSALASGRPLNESLKRASAAAAIVVSQVGCAPAMPNASELETFLKNHPGITNGKEADHAHTAF
jgi:5-dehydro-2-deoxygluconokinase